jgi:hypothetical protein
MADRATALSDQFTARGQLLELQVEQHHHDETYHREIARLSLHQRLNHMALHFAKYTGKIAASSEPSAITAIYVDVLIIALSTANIVNVELYDLLEKDGQQFPSLIAFGRSLAAGMKSDLAEHASLVRKTAITTGRMAAACEKIDHLEEIPFRAEIRDCVASLAALALAFITARGIDPTSAIHDRLDRVKSRLKLHGRI